MITRDMGCIGRFFQVRRRVTTWLLGIVWVICICSAGLAWAQTPSLDGADVAEDKQKKSLDTLIVTGERVERSLMDTAASVSVFNADIIDQMAGMDGTNSLQGHLANVVSVEPGNYAPAVRGIDGTGPAVGANAFFAGVRPRLNLQVDGRPATFNELIFSDVSLWDVEQVEVFRGAQSTVQGRNSIAGVVVVKTRDPSYVPESKIRTVVGDNDGRHISAMVSGPVYKDQIAFRMAVDYASRESIIDFQSYDDITDPGDYESLNFRAKMLFEPKDWNGFALVTLNHSEYQGPQGERMVRPFEESKVVTAKVPTFNPIITSGVIETQWEINNVFRLENILSYTNVDVRRTAPKDTGNVTVEGYESVLEPRLHFNSLNSRLTGFGGYYGMRAQQDESIDIMGGGTFDDKTSTNAIFFEATYALLDKLDLTMGLRYEQEKRERQGGAGVITVDYSETYEAVMPKLAVTWHVRENSTLGAVVSRGYNGGGAGITWSPPFTAYTYEPEYVWNFEVFTRHDLLDSRLQLTGNLFYSAYQDLQLPYNLSALSVVIRNAEEAIVYGLEAGVQWLVLPGLRIYGEAGLLKTEITRYQGSGHEGNNLPRSPAYSLTAGAMYLHDTGLELSADVRFTDAYYSEAGNSARGKVDPYAVANCRVGYNFGSGRVFAFVKNIFDTETPTMIDLGSTESDDTAMMLQPRSIGVGLELWF